MREIIARITTSLAIATLISACAADPANTPSPDTAVDTSGSETSATDLTWNEHIGPLLQENCGACHFLGGAGQFDLLSYASAKDFAPAALAAIQAGRMPPWPPAEGCRDYVGERHLPQADLEDLRAWYDAGAPVGDGEALVFARPTTRTLRADLQAVMPAPYTPVQTLTDDYRCFILDLTFEADTWIEAVDVDPGSAQVHHVLVYALRGEGLADAEEADAVEEGPGYACFGGPAPSRDAPAGPGGLGQNAGGGIPSQVGAWVPGLDATFLPEDSAQLIPAGSRLVMQVHYNSLAGPATADQTRIVLQRRDTPPALVWRTMPVAQLALDIKAGDASSTHSVTLPHTGPRPVTIGSAAHHMHTLGRQIMGEVVRADGRDECLLDIPKWDFQWQMSYRFDDAAQVVLQPGDSVRLTCTYDNSAANQPVVDGARMEPRDVTWGEGTADEMCLMYLGVLTPLAETVATTTTGPACAAAEDCYDACDPGDATCLFACEEVSIACLGCMLPELATCGAGPCVLQLVTARECLTRCGQSVMAFGGSFGGCMTAICPETLEAATTCLGQHLPSKDCQTAVESCGL